MSRESSQKQGNLPLEPTTREAFLLVSKDDSDPASLAPESPLILAQTKGLNQLKSDFLFDFQFGGFVLHLLIFYFYKDLLKSDKIQTSLLQLPVYGHQMPSVRIDLQTLTNLF